MESFVDIGQRAMEALVAAIRDELVANKRAHVAELGTFTVIETSTRAEFSAEETVLIPPACQIAFAPETENSNG